MTSPSLRRAVEPAIVGRIAVALVVVLAACVVAARLLGPDHDGSAAAFERTFRAACSRSGADEQDCRCALAAWSETVGDQQRAELDRRLAQGEALPASLEVELQGALAEC